MVNLTIDGQLVEVPEGTTVLEAARKIGVKIPTLCYYEAIKPYGGCRLCLVEVTAGNRTFRTASCTYPVSEGLKVVTDSELVLKRRRMVIDLLWSKCPEVPILAEIAGELGLKEPSFPKGEDDCILCGLCTRMCAESQGVGAISFHGRGGKRQVMTPFGEFSEVCRTCGACAFVCPTGHIKDIAKISGKTPKPKYDEFNAGLETRGNIFRLYPQAVPATPAIDRSTCIQSLTGDCGACAESCPADAIDYLQQDVRETLNVGAVIISAGLSDLRSRQVRDLPLRQVSQCGDLPGVRADSLGLGALRGPPGAALGPQGTQEDRLAPVRGFPGCEVPHLLFLRLLHVRHQGGGDRQGARSLSA